MRALAPRARYSAAPVEGELAVAQDDDPVGLLELLEVLRREDRRRRLRLATPRAAPTAAARWPGSSDAVGSSSSSTLGSPSKRDREVEALPVPDRELAVGRRSCREAPSVRRPLGLSVQPGEELEVLARRQPPVVRRPLRHPADARALALDAAARSARAPRRGCESSVDLPAPFGPTSATRLALASSRSSGASTRRAPKLRDTPVAARSDAQRPGGSVQSASSIRTTPIIAAEEFGPWTWRRRPSRPPGAGSPGTAAGTQVSGRTGLWCRAWLRPDNGTPRACVRAGDVHLGSGIAERHSGRILLAIFGSAVARS